LLWAYGANKIEKLKTKKFVNTNLGKQEKGTINMAELKNLTAKGLYDDHRQLLMTIQGVQFSLIKIDDHYEIMNLQEREPHGLGHIEDLFEYFEYQIEAGYLS